MKQRSAPKLLVLAFCITHSFSFAQQNKTGVCRLGEITNDSILPYIQSLVVDCNKDVKTYLKKSKQLTAVQQLELKGDTDAKEWELLFNKIKVQPSVKTIVFNENTFTALPYGYEGLYAVEKLSFKNNDELHYPSLIDQLALLPNIKELSVEVVTVFELPATLDELKNIQMLQIINIDESISKNDTMLIALSKEPVTYDYYLQKTDEQFARVKYTAMAGEIDSDEYKELSKRFKTTMNPDGMTLTKFPFGIKYKNVQPPIAGLDVERTTYTINPQIENVITYPSGTLIRIPANTFVDKDGNTITSSVALSYREFRDPVDFLVSGIPMKYDTANTVNNFESAGMFELTASLNNEQLGLAKDKCIDMNFATTSKDSTYNFYAFNDSTGNWEYKEKPKTVSPATTIRLTGPTVAYYNFKNFLANRAIIEDSTSMEKRFESNEYIFTYVKNAPGPQFVNYKFKGERRHKRASALIRVNRVKKTKEGEVVFRVETISNAHPEMKPFNDVYFVSNEHISASEFKKKYARKKFYNDIRIYGNSGDLKIKLKDDNSIKDLSASVVTISDKGEVKPVKNITARMKQYNKSLKSRERTFNRNMKKGRLINNEIVVNDAKQKKMYAYERTKKYMNDNEKKMSFDEWMSYHNQQEANYVAWMTQTNKPYIDSIGKQQASSSGLMQSLQLSGTGIFNCDQIQRLQNPVEIFASYKSTDGSKLRPKAAYLIDKKTNAVLQYDGRYGYSAAKIAFSTGAEAENTMLTIEQDGALALYKTEDFKKQVFTNKSHFDFVVTKINSNFTTVSDLKTFIGF